MINSYLIQIKINQEFAQARIFNLNKDFYFQLLVNRNLLPTFNRRFLSINREVIVYIRNERLSLRDSFLEFIKVEVGEKDDLACILKAINVLFPRSDIFISTPKTEYRKLRNLFKNFVFLTEEECFSR